MLPIIKMCPLNVSINISKYNSVIIKILKESFKSSLNSVLGISKKIVLPFSKSKCLQKNSKLFWDKVKKKVKLK